MPCAVRLFLSFACVLTVGCRSGGPAANLSPAAEPTAPYLERCVDFRALKPYLPAEVAGFALVKEQGSSGKYGEVSVSEAERIFQQQEQRIAVRIVDTTLVDKLGASLQVAAAEANGLPESDPTQPLRFPNAVGFVRYDAAGERAEANLLVGNRFVVAVTGTGVVGTEEVRHVAQGLNLAGLSNLR